MTYQDTLNKRRSVYALSDQLPVSENEAVKTIEDAIVASPSAFNMQSARAVVLLGDAVKTLWNSIAHDALKAVVPADAFAATEAKLAGFAASAGTVLFFEDEDVVSGFKANVPAYAHNFDTWAAQGQGIAQINVWNALAEKGIGANLQHYNPLIDEGVAKTWDIPSSWRLVGQLNFGGIAGPAGEYQRLDAGERVRVVR